MYAIVVNSFMVVFRGIWSVFNLVVITPIYYFVYIQYMLVLHLLLIPIQLLVLITIYTALIKIPIVIPLSYVLELNDSNPERADNAWLAAQLHLFFVNFTHFAMVSVFLGICAGTILGWNIIGIRYLLTWGKRKTKKGSRSLYKSYQGSKVSTRNANISSPDRKRFVTPVSSAKSSPRRDASAQSTPLLSRLLNTVVVDDHTETRATGSNIHTSGNLRGRLTNKTKQELVYEDDDGYSYSMYSKRLKEQLPQIVSPLKQNKRSSEKGTDSKKTTFAQPVEAELPLADPIEEEIGTIAEESETESMNDGATLFSNVRNDATLASSVREEPK